MLTLLSILFAANVGATSSIKATIRGTNAPVEVTLLRRDGDSDWQPIAHRSLPASQRLAAFDGLAAGVYQVHVRRADGGEQVGTKVIVGAGDTRSADIVADPIDVVGRVTLGDVPLTDARVVLKHREMQWRLAVQAGHDGVFHARLWQRGSFSYAVRSSTLASIYGDFVDIGGRPPFRWELRLPDRRIAGSVRDRVSGAPVAGAALQIDSVSGEVKHHQNLLAGSDGRFDLAGMKPGRVTVTASRDGYLEDTSAPIELAESDHVRELAVDLEPGSVVPMIVGDSGGQPLAGAELLTVVDGNVRARATTGSDGRARVTLPHDRAATVYAIPRDGSFAVVAVAKAAEAPRRITVARATSTLHIVTRTTEGKPLPNVDLLMRANGEIIPPAVADELEALQDLRLRTDEHGEALLHNLPAGSYEFWPYSGASEAEALVETAGNLLAPIVVNVKTGENAVAVNFRTR
jgi:hypothetical protein